MGDPTPTVDWVDEVPSRSQPRPTAYDGIAEEVRGSGRTAKVTSTEKEYNKLAQRLRERFTDLTVAARKIGDEFFVFISPDAPEKKGKK